MLVREKGYGNSIAEFYGVSQNAIQKQLNPRYAFYAPLKSAVEAYPLEITKKLAMTRTRSRITQTICACDFELNANMQRAFAHLKARQVRVMNNFC